MNINIDNYEEYFLLFADNELSAEEKNIVEAFIKEHAELEEEFLNIKQSVFKTESDVKLKDKSSLFRRTKTFIDHTNYEEVFLLYNDNELISYEREETEEFLAENPSLKSEFELLQKAKLQPDNAIVFPDKKLLFKKEDGGKVVPFKWWRAIAAAIIIGIGTWIAVDFRKINKDDATVTVKNIGETPVKIKPAQTDTASLQQVNVIADKKTVTTSLKQRTLQNNINRLPVKSPSVNEQALTKQQQKNELPQINNTPVKIEKEEVNIAVKEIQENNKELVKQSNDVENSNYDEISRDEIINADKNYVPDALTASYAADENENSNNYAFYNITEEKFNKTKVGSFLRKVKRVIERKISPLSNSKNQREVAVN